MNTEPTVSQMRKTACQILPITLLLSNSTLNKAGKPNSQQRADTSIRKPCNISCDQPSTAFTLSACHKPRESRESENTIKLITTKIKRGKKSECPFLGVDCSIVIPKYEIKIPRILRYSFYKQQ